MKKYQICLFFILLFSFYISNAQIRNENILPTLNPSSWKYVGDQNLITTSAGPIQVETVSEASNYNSFIFRENIPLIGFSHPFLLKEFNSFFSSWSDFSSFSTLRLDEMALTYDKIRGDTYSIGKYENSTSTYVNYMRFHGGVGQSLPMPNVPPHYDTTNSSNLFQFAFVKNTPYFIYRTDSSHSNQRRLCISYYDDRSSMWRDRGVNPISTAQAANVRFKYPYIIYNDHGENDKYIVKKYENGWVTVGDFGLTTPPQQTSSSPADITNDGYVALADTNQNNKLSVLKFNGTDWEYVGSPGFTEFNLFSGVSIYKENDSEIYVLFGDINTLPESYNRANVMKYDGNTWSYVGSPNFSIGGIVSNQNYGIKKINNKIYVMYKEVYCPSFCSERVVMMEYLEPRGRKISSSQLNKENNITLFPNPVNDKLFIKNYKKKNILNIQIINSFGEVIFETESINNYISFKNFKKGYYLIKINTPNGPVYNKILKN